MNFLSIPLIISPFYLFPLSFPPSPSLPLSSPPLLHLLPPSFSTSLLFLFLSLSLIRYSLTLFFTPPISSLIHTAFPFFISVLHSSSSFLLFFISFLNLLFPFLSLSSTHTHFSLFFPQSVIHSLIFIFTVHSFIQSYILMLIQCSFYSSSQCWTRAVRLIFSPSLIFWTLTHSLNSCSFVFLMVITAASLPLSFSPFINTNTYSFLPFSLHSLSFSHFLTHDHILPILSLPSSLSHSPSPLIRSRHLTLFYRHYQRNYQQHLSSAPFVLFFFCTWNAYVVHGAMCVTSRFMLP